MKSRKQIKNPNFLTVGQLINKFQVPCYAAQRFNTLSHLRFRYHEYLGLEDVTSCCLTDGYRPVRIPFSFRVQDSHFYPENVGRRFSRNATSNLPNHTTSLTRTHTHTHWDHKLGSIRDKYTDCWSLSWARWIQFTSSEYNVI